MSLTPAGGEVAKSGDLGYTYGAYELRGGGRPVEKGFYAHIWKRDGGGRRRIVVTNHSPEPVAAKAD